MILIMTLMMLFHRLGRIVTEHSFVEPSDMSGTLFVLPFRDDIYDLFFRQV